VAGVAAARTARPLKVAAVAPAPAPTTRWVKLTARNARAVRVAVH
jgi:hypothetical protein